MADNRTNGGILLSDAGCGILRADGKAELYCNCDCGECNSQFISQVQRYGGGNPQWYPNQFNLNVCGTNLHSSRTNVGINVAAGVYIKVSAGDINGNWKMCHYFYTDIWGIDRSHWRCSRPLSQLYAYTQYSDSSCTVEVTADRWYIFRIEMWHYHDSYNNTDSVSFSLIAGITASATAETWGLADMVNSEVTVNNQFPNTLDTIGHGSTYYPTGLVLSGAPAPLRACGEVAI